MPEDLEIQPAPAPAPVAGERRAPDPAAVRSSYAQVVIAFGVLIAILYYGQLVIATVLLSTLLAFVLAPIVDRLEMARMPRAVAAGVAVLLLIAIVWGLTYLLYARAVAFMDELPKYSRQIREHVIKVRKQAESFQRTTETILPDSPEERSATKVQQARGWSDYLMRSVRTVTELIFAISFVPFLVYFMLTWQEHIRSATVMLFDMRNRNTAYVTLGHISAMLRSFIIGNVVVGLFMAVLSAIIFWWLGVPYPIFIGFISGFVSLLPYMGVVIAMLPPIAAGIGVLGKTEFFWIVVSVLVLHVFALNVLYPKILGKRMSLNPVVVTVALLVWGTLWGAMGLLLAVPIAAGTKIICDHVDRLRPIGAWMGE